MEFAGTIERGKLKLHNRALLDDYLKAQRDGQRMRVRITRQQRSLRQNAYYWGVVVPIIANHTGYGQEECHDALKSLFLGRRVLELGGKEVVCSRSTTSLDTQEFSKYTEEITAWAATELGLYIPQPGE